MCDSYQFVLEKSTRVQISEDMARGVWYSYKLSKSSNSFVKEKQTFMSPVSYLRDNCLIHSSFCSNHGNHGHWADGPMQVRLWEVILQVSEKKAPQLCGCCQNMFYMSSVWCSLHWMKSKQLVALLREHARINFMIY